jgi:hypothetical protein
MVYLLLVAIVIAVIAQVLKGPCSPAATLKIARFKDVRAAVEPLVKSTRERDNKVATWLANLMNIRTNKENKNKPQRKLCLNQA